MRVINNTSDEINEREIVPPITEIDEPPSHNQSTNSTFTELSASDKKDLLKWSKNYDFLMCIIGIILLLYVFDTFIIFWKPEVQSTLRDPIFELLKTVLFTVSGYIFGKKHDCD